MLRQFLWKIFPPFEVEATRKEFQRFINESDDMNAGRLVAEQLVNRSIRQSAEAIVRGIRFDGEKVEKVALLITAGILRFHLKSGTYHVYRGVLTNAGNGMYAIWRRAVSRMTEAGYLSEEEASEIRNSIAQELKGVG